MRGRLLVAVVAALAVTGCSSGTGGSPAAAPSPQAGDCEATVGALLASGQDYLDSLAEDGAPLSTSVPQADASASVAEDPAAAGDRFRAALIDLRGYAQQIGCDQQEVQRQIVAGVRGLRAGGPVATAVQAQLTAQLASARPPTAPLRPGDDLAAAIGATADAGVVRLGPGRFELGEALVLLRAVTLEGSGHDTTVLTTSSSEGTVLVLTTDPVALRGLSLERVGGTPASVLTAAPGATLTLQAVRASGAVAEPEGGGGAGVLLSGGAGGQEGTTRRTTLRMTDSVVEGNGSAGLLVTGDHRVEVVGLRATGNGDCGVCFLGDSDGTLVDAELHDNGAGVLVGGRAAPVVRGGTITGGAVGVQVLGTSRPELAGLAVRGASRAGIVWGDAATGVVRDATCTEVPFGLVVGPDAAPTVEGEGCRLARGQ